MPRAPGYGMMLQWHMKFVTDLQGKIWPRNACCLTRPETHQEMTTGEKTLTGHTSGPLGCFGPYSGSSRSSATGSRPAGVPFTLLLAANSSLNAEGLGCPLRSLRTGII